MTLPTSPSPLTRQETGRMTAAQARDIADETIAYWRGDHQHRPPSAPEVWREISPDPYPGGGWERVRALMVWWLLVDDDARRQPVDFVPQRRAA